VYISIYETNWAHLVLSEELERGEAPDPVPLAELLSSSGAVDGAHAHALLALEGLGGRDVAGLEVGAVAAPDKQKRYQSEDKGDRTINFILLFARWNRKRAGRKQADTQKS
jgi:hypothetical protein